MPVVRISSVLRNAPQVAHQACVYGIDCEVIQKTDPANIVFELVGDSNKIDRIATITNSKVVSPVA